MSSSQTTISVKQSPKPAKAKKAKAKKRNKAPKSRRVSKNRSDKDCYARLLNDPFNNNPCKLGYSCMVPTQTGTMFFRQTIPCNADGSIAIFAQPTLGATGGGIAPMFLNQAGAGVATWTSLHWNNIAQFPTTITDMARVLSVGLKVTPLVSVNSTPGICYAGAVSGESTDEIVALSPNLLGKLTSLSNFVTSNNVLQAHSRPIDNSAYEFSTLSYTGLNTASYSHSSPLIALTGYPASANILVEAILHFEFIPTTSTGFGRSNDVDVDPREDKISSSFPSFEEMWQYTSSRLDPSAIIDLGTSALTYLNARTINGLVNGVGQRRLN